jgi:hypothetical protein
MLRMVCTLRSGCARSPISRNTAIFMIESDGGECDCIPLNTESEMVGAVNAHHIEILQFVLDGGPFFLQSLSVLSMFSQGFGVLIHYPSIQR